MKFRAYHGRLDPKGPASTEEGMLVDDWGFDGPTFDGVEEIGYTYGTFSLYFTDEWLQQCAKDCTGWKEGAGENSLEMEFEEDCLRAYNKARERFEFFGDWWVK